MRSNLKRRSQWELYKWRLKWRSYQFIYLANRRKEREVHSDQNRNYKVQEYYQENRIDAWVCIKKKNLCLKLYNIEDIKYFSKFLNYNVFSVSKPKAYYSNHPELTYKPPHMEHRHCCLHGNVWLEMST